MFFSHYPCETLGVQKGKGSMQKWGTRGWGWKGPEGTSLKVCREDLSVGLAGGGAWGEQLSKNGVSRGVLKGPEGV